MTNAEYENAEARRYLAKIESVERAPLTDRQAARAEWREACAATPSIVAERIGWLLDGNYGYGAHVRAWDVMSSPRMDRAANLSTTIAALEWGCPGAFAREAYKTLTAEQRERLDRYVAAVLEDYATEAAEAAEGAL